MLKLVEQTIRGFWSEHRQLAQRWIVLLTMVGLAILSVWQYRSMPTTLKVAVGPSGSDREAVAKALARALADAKKPVRLKTVTAKDSAEAANLLNRGKVQLALLRSDEPKVADARAFAIVGRRAILLVAKAAREQAVDQFSARALSGKKITIVTDGTGADRALVARLLAHSGLSEPAIRLTEAPFPRAGSALAAGEADVLALVIDPRLDASRQLVAGIAKATGGELAVGPVPSAEGLASVHRDLSVTHIAAGTLGGASPLPDSKLTTVAITEELVGDSDLAESTGTQLSKALLDSRGKLLAGTSPIELEQPPLDAIRRFMPHTGVASQASDKSQSFFETYSDEIWLGIFALGLVGSSLAGFASWLGLYRQAGPNAFFRDIQQIVSEIARARIQPEVEALRRRLREVTAAHVKTELESGGEEVTAAHHRQWLELVDTLAVHRLEEIARSAQTPVPPAT